MSLVKNHNNLPREFERNRIAHQRIDLDDGVKVSHLKFKGAVVPMRGPEKPEEE